ncbi:MAG TPA: hypothetical protein EYM98_02695 [Dehalococcoidia bacterium]|nr:hypothetical protein [Dehalococcoidia bacterium]
MLFHGLSERIIIIVCLCGWGNSSSNVTT